MKKKTKQPKIKNNYEFRSVISIMTHGNLLYYGETGLAKYERKLVEDFYECKNATEEIKRRLSLCKCLFVPKRKKTKFTKSPKRFRRK